MARVERTARAVLGLLLAGLLLPAPAAAGHPSPSGVQGAHPPAEAAPSEDSRSGRTGRPGNRASLGTTIVIDEPDELFPSYDRLCGYRVTSLVTRRLAEAARAPSGEPVIVLDPGLWAPGQEAHRTFLLAHECAHHRLGHVAEEVLAARRADQSVVADHELSADCWAAEALARDGQDEVLRIASERFWRAGAISPGAGYPSGIQRSLIIRKCWEAVRGEAGAPPR